MIRLSRLILAFQYKKLPFSNFSSHRFKMSTAHKTDEEKKEHFDTPEELDQKVEILAKLIKESKHFIAFTGAGISTSAGVPDFRSGINTVLPTGPGAWERIATGTNKKAQIRKNTTSAIPTPTHMALIKLHEAGYLKFLISQNTDGLHRRSGFPLSELAELHGNSNLEICRNKKCKKQYLRDFRVRTSQKVHDHETRRKCENCGQELYDTIINFGENLPEKELENGFIHGKKVDLCLALGSSLRVTPAADMPRATVKNKGNLVIVNLQATPLDHVGLRINGFIDDVMIKLMAKLNLEIPKFILKRRLVIKKIYDKSGLFDVGKPTGLYIRGVDEFGESYQLFKAISVKFNQSEEVITSTKHEPFYIIPLKSSLHEGSISIKLTFQGHYNEPDFNFDIPLEFSGVDEPLYYLLEFDPQIGKWISCKPFEVEKS